MSLADARGLFELAIAGPKKFAPDVARPLWERWTRYVYQYSDLAAAQEMEKRMAEAYPNGSVFV
jgi:cleavage stimulation factor subunit 3